MTLIRKFILLGLMLISGNIIFAQSKLLAPAYPGAVISPLRGDKTESVFLSKDNIKKVKAFYDYKVGILSDKGPLTQSDYFSNLREVHFVSYGKTIITQHQIVRQRGYPGPGAKDAGVLLLAKVPTNQDTANSKVKTNQVPNDTSGESAYQKQLDRFFKRVTQAQKKESISKTDAAIMGMSDLFDGFKSEVYMQRHSKKELLAVYNKHKFLDFSYYRLVKDKNGKLVSFAHHLLMQYKHKLSYKDFNTDLWNYWLGFLKKLAAHAYRTIIFINTKPSSWNQH